jgi:predicted nucleic acid-binding protein
MTGPCFVDTDVLVYWRDARDPVKQLRAREWLELLWREQRGRTSMQVLAEFYSVMTRKFSTRITPDEAWRDVQAILAWKPQAIDSEILRRAHEIEVKHRLNWWDAQVVAAAQAQGCALLLSEDMQDGAEYGGVIVRSPFTLRIAEEAAAYAPAPRLEPKHRGRGRPRMRPQRTATLTG